MHSMFATLSSGEEFWLIVLVIFLIVGLAVKKAVDTTKAAVSKVASKSFAGAVARSAATSFFRRLLR